MTGVREQAANWLVRQQDPGFAHWEDFAQWLQAAPENAAAYNEMSAMTDALASEIASRPVQTDVADIRPLSRRTGRLSRRSLLAVSTAAAASIGLFWLAGPGSSPDRQTIATGPGEQRTVTLAGGTSIRMNGTTRVEIERSNPRFVALQSGEALFDVVHDARSPFRVEVGGATVEDLGTRFNISRTGGTTSVGVAEGEVVYRTGTRSWHMKPGDVLVDGDNREPERVRADPHDIGTWTDGVLIYEEAPLEAVAGDLARNLGVRVEVRAEERSRPVSAIIQLSPDAETSLREAALTMGLNARRAGEAWALEEKR